MTGSCGPDGCESVFTARFARQAAKRYRNHGLSPAAARIVEFAVGQGIEGATVLEIGGGVGEIQLELLRRGAATATNLEVSTSYEAEAARLLEEFGMASRAARSFVDIAASPESVEPADVVIMHRVVCCYPDYQRLLSAASGHARRMLIFSHPPDSRLARAAIWSENALRALRRNPFRAFIHSPQAMLAVAENEGLTALYRHHSWDWDVIGATRRGV